VLYGAYALLERLGLRFYDLNEVREPRTRASRLPASLAIDERPAFAVRGLWAWEPRGHDAFFLWMARNRLNLWTSAEPNRAHLRMLGIGLTGGGHNVEKALFDPEGASDVRGRTRFQAHPEWYGLKGGRRVPGIGAEFGLNFCTSNRDAVAELVRGLIESLERGELSESDVVNLWPLDAGTWCECANCAAQGSPSDRWLTVLAAASDGVRAARASGALTHPVALLAPAYLETWKAPEHPAASSDPAVGVTFFPYYRCYAHALEDSSCTEINAPIAAHLRGWVERWRGPLWIGEYYNVSWTKSLPVLFASVLAADLRAYAAHGAVGLHYMHAPARLWGSWTLQHALYARLAWSPRANLDSLIGDFVAHEHAEAPKDMRAFYASLELATSNLQALQTSVGAIGSGNYEYLLRPGRSSYLIRHLDPVRGGAENAAPKVAEMEQAWRSARHSLDRAKAATRDPAARARLELVERRFEYGRAMFEFYRQILDAALAHHTRRTDVVRERLAIADSLAERLEAITDLVQVSASHANARNGLEASQSVRVYELLRRMYPPASR
jgi:hypothetical protein